MICGEILRVNGLITHPPSSRKLQDGLIQAFREQMYDDVPEEDEE